MKSIFWGNFEGEQIAKVRCSRVPMKLFVLLLRPNESQRLYWPKKDFLFVSLGSTLIKMLKPELCRQKEFVYTRKLHY